MENSTTEPFNTANSNAMLGDVWAKIFKLFTISDEDKFKEPFQNENYILATDKLSMLKVEESIVRKFFNSENVPNGISLFPCENNSNLILEVSKIRTVLESSKKYFEEMFDIGFMTCPDCDGNFFVKYEFTNYLGKKKQLEGECPTCDYTGKIELNINRQTGEKLEEKPKNIIKISNVKFEYDRILRLVLTAELLKEDKIKVRFINEHKAVFQIGECEILDMSAKFWDGVECVSSHIA